MLSVPQGDVSCITSENGYDNATGDSITLLYIAFTLGSGALPPQSFLMAQVECVSILWKRPLLARFLPGSPSAMKQSILSWNILVRLQFSARLLFT